MNCFDCPRKCGVDRSQNIGFCGEGEKIHVSKIIENFMWEEPCICHDKGALAIFFGGCNLRCIYCQNMKISRPNTIGNFYTPQQFIDLLKGYDLSKFDCIDLISPTQFTSALISAFSNFKSPIPVVWNSNSYENVEKIKQICDFVDIFLLDYKYSQNELGKKLSLCENYPSIAKDVIKCAFERKKIVFEKSKLVQGVIVRHLILPGLMQNSLDCVKDIAGISTEIIISIMSQFTPMGNKILNRQIYPLENKIILSKVRNLGFKRGFCQDLTSSCDNFIPDF